MKHEDWREVAKTLNAFRIFPRIFISVYTYLVYAVTTWYMALETPSPSQAALVTVVVGGSVGFFTAYAATGNSHTPFLPTYSNVGPGGVQHAAGMAPPPVQHNYGPNINQAPASYVPPAYPGSQGLD